MKKTKITLYKQSIPIEIDLNATSAWSEKEQESLDFYLSLIQPRTLIFDVGAHTGGKTDLFLACKAKVVCIEPQPECIEVLRSKYMHRNDVSIERTGLGASEECLEMMVCSEAPTISTFSSDWVTKSRFTEFGYHWDRKVMVPMTTLDCMIRKYGLPSFCKIDAENYEFEIFKGLSQKIPCLSFEVTEEGAEKTALSLQRLSFLGYREFNFTPGGRALFLNAEWIDAKTLSAQLERMIQEVDCSGMGKMYGDVYARSSLT